MFIGRTVATQAIGDGVCEGTVGSFTTTGESEYSIQYTDGTTAALTQAALKKVLLPPPDAATATAPAVIGRTVVTDGVPTTAETYTKAPPEDGPAIAAASHTAATLDEAAATEGTVTKAAVQRQRTN